MNMVIERDKAEVVIRLSASGNEDEIQHIINWIQYKETVSKSKATQEDIDAVLNEAAAGRRTWWTENRNRLLNNENNC
jgi:hypothetical protein